jgi:hypothetical protein
VLEYLLLFIIGSYVFFSGIKNPTNKHEFLFVIIMISISGFRDMIGGYDVYIYGDLYENFKSSNYLLDFELGFVYYFKFLRLFSIKREFMFFVTSLIMIYSHTKLIFKNSNNFQISLFLYFAKFFLFTFIYLRQGLAMAILWQGFLFYKKENKLVFSLLLFVAFFIHKSSLVFVLVYTIDKFKLNYFYFFFFILLFSVLLIDSSVSNYLINYTEGVNEKYSNYTTVYKNSFNVFYLLESVFLIYLIWRFKKYFYENRDGTMIINGVFLYLIFLVLSFNNPTYIRLTWYFLIFYILFLTRIFKLIKLNVNKSIYIISLYVYFSIVFFRLLFNFDGGDLLPYKSIFNNFQRNGAWEYIEYR